MRRTSLALRALVCVLSLLGACDSDDGTDLSNASCAELGAHLERVCGDGIWSLEAAELEEDCEIFGIDAAERACLGRATRCDESLGECGLSATTWGCHQGDDDCPPGLRCDLEEEECFACFADTDCDASRLCVDRAARQVPTTPSVATIRSATPRSSFCVSARPASLRAAAHRNAPRTRTAASTARSRAASALGSAWATASTSAWTPPNAR